MFQKIKIFQKFAKKIVLFNSGFKIFFKKQGKGRKCPILCVTGNFINLMKLKMGNVIKKGEKRKMLINLGNRKNG